MLSYALFVASLDSGDTVQKSRALLLSAVLCERFHSWYKPWPPKVWLTMSAEPVAHSDAAKLKQVLTERFDNGELRDLCSELGVDHENLGAGKAEKIRGLIAYLDRRNRLPDLAEAIRRSRPDISW